jgi:hypothetical protein
LTVHANWNKGTISYKFQSGPEKLEMSVYADTDADRLDTSVSYKNQAASTFMDLSDGSFSSSDVGALAYLVQSITPSFLQNIQRLLAELPQSTMRLQALRKVATALLSRTEPSGPVVESLTMPWDYAAYAVCYAAWAAGGDAADGEEVCYHKYIAKDWH